MSPRAQLVFDCVLCVFTGPLFVCFRVFLCVSCVFLLVVVGYVVCLSAIAWKDSFPRNDLQHVDVHVKPYSLTNAPATSIVAIKIVIMATHVSFPWRSRRSEKTWLLSVLSISAMSISSKLRQMTNAYWQLTTKNLPIRRIATSKSYGTTIEIREANSEIDALS